MVRDEQRVQAYMALIGQLLGCPSGQEPEVLQQNQVLVNEGVVLRILIMTDLSFVSDLTLN